MFASLELAKKHSWKNVQENNQVTLLFFEPPAVSFEVRGHVEVVQEGNKYHKLINAQHDVYHEPNPEGWKSRPAYIFLIDEIYNNSVSKQGFGTRMM